MRRLLGASVLLTCACFVEGKDVIGPTEPDYLVICVDSSATDSSRVCYEGTDSVRLRLEVTLNTYTFPGR